MPEDFRVHISLVNHPKFFRLKRIIGPSAMEILIRLFTYCAMNKSATRGSLEGLEADDIALICGWRSNGTERTGSQRLVDSLLATGWLEKKDGGSVFYVHDWAEHNPFVASYTERQEAARKAGLASAESRRKNKEIKNNATRSKPRQKPTDRERESNDPLNDPLNNRLNETGTPSPSPSPLPSPLHNLSTSTLVRSSGEPSGQWVEDTLRDLIDYHHAKHAEHLRSTGREPPKFRSSPNTGETHNRIRSLLQRGLSYEEGARLIDGMFNDDWFTKNDRLGLKHAFDEKNRETFLGKSNGKRIELNGREKEKFQELVSLGASPEEAMEYIARKHVGWNL